MAETVYRLGKRDRDGKRLEVDPGCGLGKPPSGGSVLPTPLDIVGHCPYCGAPIYGPKQVVGEPEIRYSCECRKRCGPSETKEA